MLLNLGILLLAAMADSIDVDIRMEEAEEDSLFQCEVSVLVTDANGSPLPEATIEVTSDSYSETKSASNHGMSTTFAGVPIPATLRTTASGYKTVEIDLTESSVNSTVRNY